MGSRKSFAARLSFNILLITTVLFTAAIVIEGVSSHKLLAEEATRSTERLLDGTIADIQTVLCGLETAVKNAAWVVGEHIDDTTYMYHITSKIVTENPDVVGSAIAYRKGYFPDRYWVSPYSYSDPATGELKDKNLGSEEYDFYDMDWFYAPMADGQAHWSEPYSDDGGGGYLMTTYSYPVLDENWDVVAIITADLSLQWIEDKMQQIKPYENSAVSLISQKGHYLNISNQEDLHNATIYSTLAKAGSPADLKAIVDAMMNGEKGVKQYRRGTKVSFAVFGPVNNGWIASITCGYKEVLAGTTKMHLHLILNAFINLLLQFLLGFLIIRRITRPLSSISESALSIAKGNFNTKLPEIKYEDEIYQLRTSFDYMQSSLNTYMEDLKVSTAANERYASELHVAASIQMAMVPKQFPHSRELDMDAFIKPAKEVGGDLYDYYLHGDTLHFLVGDVSGKGVPASLVMAMTLFAFRLLASMDLDVHKLVKRVNDSVSRNNDSGMFVTLFYGRLDLKTKELTYCNAGHNPIVIVPAGGKPYFLEAKPNLALGVFDDFEYEKQSVQLAEGSHILLYTDGVTEAERGDKAQYGEDRLLAWAGEACSKGSDKTFTCNCLVDSVHEFVDGNEQNDDITIMTINI